MRVAATMLTFLMLTGATALAQDYQLGALTIDHPWVRATPPGAVTGGGFMTIHNAGSEPDRLTGGSAAIGSVQIHTMDIKDGVMHMRQLPDGLEIPAGGEVMLAPGGFHLMIVDLAKPIVEGDPIPVTLNFENAGTIEVELVVAPIGAPGPKDSAEDPQMMDHQMDGQMDHTGGEMEPQMDHSH